MGWLCMGVEIIASSIIPVCLGVDSSVMNPFECYYPKLRSYSTSDLIWSDVLQKGLKWKTQKEELKWNVSSLNIFQENQQMEIPDKIHHHHMNTKWCFYDNPPHSHSSSPSLAPRTDGKQNRIISWWPGLHPLPNSSTATQPASRCEFHSIHGLDRSNWFLFDDWIFQQFSKIKGKFVHQNECVCQWQHTERNRFGNTHQIRLVFDSFRYFFNKYFVSIKLRIRIRMFVFIPNKPKKGAKKRKIYLKPNHNPTTHFQFQFRFSNKLLTTISLWLYLCLWL